MHQVVVKAAELPKPNLSRHHRRGRHGRQHHHLGHERAQPFILTPHGKRPRASAVNEWSPNFPD